ncbi:MAG: helix-turn-helix domain-containing protein [Terriglobales bacterium]
MEQPNITKPVYRSSGSDRQTQRGRILALLIAARGGWVPLPAILDLKISQFGARILELRRSGLRIVNRRERVDGKIHSSYRLEVGPTPPTTKPTSPVPSGKQQPLFAEGVR